MNLVRFSLMLCCLILLGCGAGQYSGPTVLGFDVEMRKLMHQLVIEHQPELDPEQVVVAYMESVKEFAISMGYQPNRSGEYKYPPEMEERIMGAVEGTGDPLPTFVEEFPIDLPTWAKPLVPELKAGTLNGPRKELLRQTFLFELNKGLAG